VNIFGQLCDGLAKAHAVGIIHRDIKPANVLMTEDGIPKLTDFGLAKDDTTDNGMTMEGAVIGTLDFMPPEQRQAAELTDHRSDLWSLAATFYQMLTGKSPKIIKFSDVPALLHDALGKALEDEKEDRFQSALEMKEAVQQSATPGLNAADDLVVGEFPLKVIPDDFKQQVRQLFTEKFSHEFEGFDKLHVLPDLPGSKLANVLKTYAEGVSTNDILLLFDNTLLGSAYDGFLMTDQAIYWHNAQGPFKTLELTALDHVLCETSMLVKELYLNHSDCIKINRLKPVETVTAMLKEIVSIKSGGLGRQGIIAGPDLKDLAGAIPVSAAIIEEPVNKGLPEMTEELASEPKQEPNDGPDLKDPAGAIPASAAIIEEPVKKGFRIKIKELGGGLKRGVDRLERFSDATPGLHKLPSLGDPTGRTRQEIEGILGPTSSLSESSDGYSAKWTSLFGGQLTVLFDKDDVCQGITHNKKTL
ncbi:MAG TPA: serine/threonine protein kinase, partial [Nitrospinaceae bacterium]|nr:serine/threonine protein kinase [Nitrospinaceae bacterium]